MKVSVDWINEFVDIDISIEELSRRLTDQGVAVEGVESFGDDHILDLEITPNRPDLLSVFGIARETKAMLRKTFKKNPFNLQKEIQRGESSISIEIEQPSDCPRYTGLSMENIEVGPSPEWMSRRLEASGIRSLNNVVDITNYVLLEMGHPLHAFDAQFLKGNKIIIRRAKNSETIVTLDGISRQLDNGILLITDTQRPIAIAGIMGGANSEIKSNTRNIFIESAYFNPTLIRKGAKKLRLSTESSFRFERKADINALIPALTRASELIGEMCSGKIKGGITDIYENKKDETRKVSFSMEWLNGLLGSNLTKNDIVEPLTSLDLRLSGEGPLEVIAPSFRRDIEIREDIAEEVIRMVGFDSIPITNEITFKNVATIPDEKLKLTKIREHFVSSGYNEAVNISFISLDEINVLNLELEPIAIQNPISSNLTHLRPTLLVGLFEAVKRNLNAGARDIRLFEIGNVFVHDAGNTKISEPIHLAAITSGKAKHDDWRGENRFLDYYDLKGDLENLFCKTLKRGLDFGQENANLSFLEGTTLTIGNENIGFIGSIKRETTEYFDIAPRLFALEIDLSSILKQVSLDRKFIAFPKYPALLRDICLLVPNGVTHSSIVKVINETAKGMIETIRLFDTYSNEKIGPQKKSLTYSLSFRVNDRTLNDEEINLKMQEILKALHTKLGIKLRGEEQNDSA